MFTQDDFAAFIRYAHRERSLDASANAANPDRCSPELMSLATLREINKKMLFNESTHNKPPRD